MIPETFEYTAPVTLEEALELMAEGDRKAMAGGQSLIPLMKLRLATPEKVVDLGRVPGLDGIAESGGGLLIGAMATHYAIASSPLVRARCPLVAEAAAHIGDVQVRNLGTIGGSIAHADPAADYPAPLLALEAQLHLVSAHGERTLAADDFFLDAFTNALEPGELVRAVELPSEGALEGYRYEKMPHPASGFAVVGVAVRVELRDGRVAMARIAVTGMSPRAFRARAAEKLLEEGAPIETAVAQLDEGQEANSDLYASSDYRRHLARVHAARAISIAVSRAS